MEGVQKGAQKEAVLSLQRHTSKLSPTLHHHCWSPWLQSEYALRVCLYPWLTSSGVYVCVCHCSSGHTKWVNCSSNHSVYAASSQD